MTTTTTKTLPCVITQDDRLRFGLEISEQTVRLGETRDRKKEVAAQYAAQEREMDGRISRLANILTSGVEHREVRCETVFDAGAGDEVTIRTDTGEEIERRHVAQPVLPIEDDLPTIYQISEAIHALADADPTIEIHGHDQAAEASADEPADIIEDHETVTPAAAPLIEVGTVLRRKPRAYGETYEAVVTAITDEGTCILNTPQGECEDTIEEIQARFDVVGGATEPHQALTRKARRYLTPAGETVAVMPGLAGPNRQYGAMKSSKAGGTHRHRGVPMCDSEDYAQARLDAYAREHGWQEVPA